MINKANTSTDFQFGFKETSSTTQCTFVLNEVLQYYLNNSGSVYTTFLDASKAFDSVKYDDLFNIIVTVSMLGTLVVTILVQGRGIHETRNNVDFRMDLLTQFQLVLA